MLYVPTITYNDSSSGVETIYALHPTTGSIAWHLSFQLQALHFSAGADLLFISLGDSKISAYHANNGTLAWQTYNNFIKPASSSFDLSFIQQTLYFFSNNPSATPNNASIVALNPTNGSLIWTRTLETRKSNNDSDSIQLSRSGSRLYLHSNNILYALDAANGTTLWQTTLGFSAGAPTIEANNIVYMTTESSIYALNARNGSHLWQHTFGDSFDSLLLFHNVLFASSSYIYPGYRNQPLCPGSNEPINTLFALNPFNGSIYWRQPNLYGPITLYSSP